MHDTKAESAEAGTVPAERPSVKSAPRSPALGARVTELRPEIAIWEGEGGSVAPIPDDELVAARRDVFAKLRKARCSDPEDRAQEAVVLLLQRRCDPFEYRGPAALRSWLFRRARGLKLRPPWLEVVAPDDLDLRPANDIEDPEQTLITKEEIRRVQRFLESLPEPHREAIVACTRVQTVPATDAERAVRKRLRHRLRRLAA